MMRRDLFLAFSLLVPHGAHAEFIISDSVEWSAEDGGNGHRYAVGALLGPTGGRRFNFTEVPISWPEARNAAIAAGGHLATITSAEEQAFIDSFTLNQPVYPDGIRVAPRQRGFMYLGGFQSPQTDAPAANWQWVTGEPFDYTNWNTTQPDDQGGDQTRLVLRRSLPPTSDGNWFDRDSASYFVVEIPVPEPASAGLALLASLVGLTRRRV